MSSDVIIPFTFESLPLRKCGTRLAALAKGSQS